jgi:hypothetical protein
MSQLTDHFSDAAGQLSDDLADLIDYSPAGNVPAVPVSAIVGHEETRAIAEQDGIKSRHVRTITLPRTSAAAGGGPFIADVRLHEQLTIDGMIYTIEAIVSQTASWTRLEAYRSVVREKARQGYRRTT